MRLWSRVIAPVFRELLVSARACRGLLPHRDVFGPTLVVGRGVTLFRCFVVLCSRYGSQKSTCSRT
ncbi:hypothetical protein Taro_033733 [Colocasia esculenta]|uniref:Uncharacterized protein n=1 Tax=Colocasia esculenta TaxID=4460 RepID=A0A843W7U1_COLES|nr:hypothetical protein [Colocasia esculenta]